MTSVLAKEGGYQVFQLHGGEWLVLILSAVSALVAIAVGFYLARDVLSRDAGTPKMQEIAKAIQEGASAYLRRQFKTILVILVPLAIVVFVTSVAVKKPDNSEARNILGTVLIQQGRVREAIEQWQETLAAEPENGNAKSNLAWVFATYPEASFRDGPKAVQLAEQARKLSGGKNPIIFRTLAAAYAESGRFPEAVDTAQRGLELATSQGNTDLATEFQSYILLYRAGTPLRDTSLTNVRSPP